jgi:thiosulfate/3-mercaptopyruvate sulfurtransferase
VVITVPAAPEKAEDMSKQQPLVDTGWLTSHLSDPSVVVVEIDNATSNYESGHVPGAVKIDWERDLLDPVVRDVIEQDAFERLVSSLGIRNEDTVVFYSAQSNWWAAVAYWYFKMYGHADVRLLDGGRRAWIANGLELSKDKPRRPRSEYHARKIDLGTRAYRDDVLGGIGNATFVDVRSAEEYTGELLAARGMSQDHPQRRGHIPTAINIPWTDTVNEDETFKSPEEIAEVYRGHGVSLDEDVVLYCRMGWRSSHSWFALAELAGAAGVRNYDGSWNEYGMLTGVPIERASA